MNILFIINQHCDLVSTQTTFMMIDSCRILSHNVKVVDLSESLAISDEALWDFDVIFIRTNPGRDLDRIEQHHQILDRLANKQSQKTTIHNDPNTLKSMITKHYLLDSSLDIIPACQQINGREDLESFIQANQGVAIIKPLVGTRGTGIRKIGMTDAASINYSEPFLAQKFIEEARLGDARVVIINGQRLIAGGITAGVLRVPKAGSILGNLHAGATPQPITWNAKLDLSVTKVEKFVQNKGISIVGADFCGSKLIELNVFSPGGLYWAEDHFKQPFAMALVNKILPH